MKAIRVHEYGEPEVMRLEDVAAPDPGPGQVLVRVYAIGVNPVDTYIRAGAYTRQPSLPYTPGSDAAGIVEAIGPGVTRVELGDRVYSAFSLSGTYAEKTLCLETQVHPLPEGVTFAQGAGVTVPYAAAYRALFQRARAVPAEVVLVHGASGGVGVAALQLAAAFGLTSIGTAGTEAGRALATVQGAHHVLDHHDPAHYQQVLELTGNRGVDIILEMLARENLGDDLKILANGGRVVVIGTRGTVTIDPRDLLAKETSILGMSVPSASEQEAAAIHAALGAGLANGTLRPIIGKELPLSEAPRAHHEILEAKAYGKIVLIP
ncbi:MAG: NADPH:quinone reductase [Syntrophobacterales bacterium]|jgi:NADPH2:quinone reductase|nr:NADPH:quinone reductase [Syntrophobacterales bacterium]